MPKSKAPGNELHIFVGLEFRIETTDPFEDLTSDKQMRCRSMPGPTAAPPKQAVTEDCVLELVKHPVAGTVRSVDPRHQITVGKAKELPYKPTSLLGEDDVRVEKQKEVAPERLGPAVTGLGRIHPVGRPQASYHTVERQRLVRRGIHDDDSLGPE